jgi:hypothetical protein
MRPVFNGFTASEFFWVALRLDPKLDPKRVFVPIPTDARTDIRVTGPQAEWGAIAAINAFNCVNAATRQLNGDHVARIVEATAEVAP